jgi:hypothetical protein
MNNVAYVVDQLIQINKISIKEEAQMRLDRLSGFVDAIFLNRMIDEPLEIAMRKDINGAKIKLGLLISGVPEVLEFTRLQARA